MLAATLGPLAGTGMERMTRMKHFLTALLTLAMVACLAWSAPPHKEIHEKIKETKLNADRAHTAMKDGKKVTFTPSHLMHVKTVKNLAKGHVIGQLNTELAGDETKLAPGKHHIYLKKEGGHWKAYAMEHGGKKVVQAARVEVKKTEKKEKLAKPHFHAKGWGYCTEYHILYEDGSEDITIICTYW